MMKQSMTFEKHVNLIENKAGKKTLTKSKKTAVPQKFSSRYQLNKTPTDIIAKSEINEIFENIERLKLSKKASFKRERSHEPLRKSPVTSDTVEVMVSNNINDVTTNKHEDTKLLQRLRQTNSSLASDDTLAIPENFTAHNSAVKTFPSINTAMSTSSKGIEINSTVEKKKQMWEKEREELQQLGSYYPWGKSGCGAPIKDQLGNVCNDYMTRKGMLSKIPDDGFSSTFCVPHNRSGLFGMSSCHNEDPSTLHAFMNSLPAHRHHHEQAPGLASDDDANRGNNNYGNHKANNKNTNNSGGGKTTPPATLAHSLAEEHDKHLGTNTVQNVSFKKSYAYGHNAPLDQIRRIELEEERQKDKEYREYLRQQIIEKEKAKRLELERQRKLDAEEEEKAYLFFKQEKQQQQLQQQLPQQQQLQPQQHQQQQQQQQQQKQDVQSQVTLHTRRRMVPLNSMEYEQRQKEILERSRMEAERDRQEKKLMKYLEMGHDISKLKAQFEAKFGPLDPGSPLNKHNEGTNGHDRNEADVDKWRNNNNNDTNDIHLNDKENERLVSKMQSIEADIVQSRKDDKRNVAVVIDKENSTGAIRRSPVKMAQKKMPIKGHNFSNVKASDQTPPRLKQKETFHITKNNTGNDTVGLNNGKNKTNRLTQGTLNNRQSKTERQVQSKMSQGFQSSEAKGGQKLNPRVNSSTGNSTERLKSLHHHQQQQQQLVQSKGNQSVAVNHLIDRKYLEEEDEDDDDDADDEEGSVDFQDALESDYNIPVALTNAVLYLRSDDRPERRRWEDGIRDLRGGGIASEQQQQNEIPNVSRNPNLEGLLSQLKLRLNEKQKKWLDYHDNFSS